MSRTDVHRPPLVQECDPFNRHLFAEVHDHSNGECDLDRYRRDGWQYGCCHMRIVVRRNLYCGCKMCTGQVDRKQHRRKERYGWRRDPLNYQ